MSVTTEQEAWRVPPHLLSLTSIYCYQNFIRIALPSSSVCQLCLVVFSK